jgi:hypothetical protein
VILIVLEIQHLKWIVWEHWDCRKHKVKHRECGCLDRAMLWL